jgi:divalent metal cation (Fe/Co/Zn/Cd) transporter
MQNGDICEKALKTKKVNNPENLNKRRLAYIEGVVSIIINTLLFVLKYWAGIVSGSIALVADAWHTLSDSLSSIIVIAGTKFVREKSK